MHRSELFLGSSVVSNIPVEESILSSTDDRKTVLIVEDNPDVVHYIGKCLENDFKLMIAMDGQEGVDKATEMVPDLIVSDVMMPRKDGFELVVELKDDERTSHIPIILLTARADADSRIAGLSRGADAYLEKPFDSEELNVRISALIESRSKLQKRYAGMEPLVPTEDKDIKIEDAFITKLNEVLLENLEDDGFGIAELCDALHLGRTQLHNKIKALTDKSTTVYVRSFRIKQSISLLRSPDMNISEVAYAVGFKDPKYYTKLFKAEHGVTPSEWVKQTAQSS
jgi:DNA-binding response OmpR family regulator